MEKRIFKLLLLPLLLLSSCKNTTDTDTSICGEDDMFCEDTNEDKDEEEVKLTLEDDTNSNYVLDNTIDNTNASVNYEIFVRSFYDSNNDQIGDLNGVKAKLPYLQSLGVKNIWLTPIHPSNSYHGYDVTDYYNVDSDYGTLTDLQSLINTARDYNIGIMLDMVFNHTSDQHPWFTQSYSDYIREQSGQTVTNSKASWYNWGKGQGNHYGTGYEANFGGYMPDLNLENEDVVNELKKICKFYIDMGVSGFRLDAVYYYFMGANLKGANFIKTLYEYCKSLNEDFYFVGECWQSQPIINTFYQSTADSFFAFPSSYASSGDASIVRVVKGQSTADAFGDAIEKQEKAMKEINPNAVSSYFLSNHDLDRISKSLYGYSAKAGASLTYLLPGTPYIYYGEEIGLKGERNTEPDDSSDARRRLPMIWSKSNKTGECQFPEQTRLDLDTTVQVTDGVEDQLATNYSQLNHYRKVLNIRNKYPFIKDSIFTNLTGSISSQNSKVLMYKLSYGDESIIVVHNFNSKITRVNIGNIATSIEEQINVSKKIPTLGSNGDLTLGGYSTVILK